MKNKELDEIRARNSARLAPMLEQVRAGTDCDLLIPCAKAYLGLFLNLDNSLTPHDRLASFVDSGLLPSVYEGFANAVQQFSFPQVAEFSELNNEARLEPCWVILAAIELGLQDQGNQYIDHMPAEVRKTAFCFVMTLEQGDRPAWPAYYAEHFQHELEQALIGSWSGRPARDSDYLAGMDWYFENISKPDPGLVYWLASHWQHFHYGNTYHLLSLAVEYCQADELQELSQKALQREMPVKVKMLWCSLGLVSDPQHYAARLQTLCGFNKEKIVPLLDFCISVMKFIDDPVRRAQISAALIRIAGPKFPPFDSSDPIVAKLLYAQQILARCPYDERKKLISELLTVRVLRAYKPALQAMTD